MKRFLIQLSKFSIFILLGYGVLILSILFLNERSLSECKIDDDVTTLIVGDSHSMWSIDDTQLVHVRNISLNAEGYIYTYAKLKYILDLPKSNIKRVFVAFSYHNLSGYYDSYISGKLSNHFFDRYIGILNIDQYFAIFKSNPLNFIKLSTIIVKNGTRHLLKNQCTLYGTFPSEKMVDHFSIESMKKRITSQYYKDNNIYPLSDLNVEYLKKLIDMCREKKIEVIMLSTPIHRKYKKMIPDRYKQLFDDFILSYQLNVIDLSDLLSSDKYFLPDGDHVNYEGAMLTTKKFKEYYELQSTVN